LGAPNLNISSRAEKSAIGAGKSQAKVSIKHMLNALNVSGTMQTRETRMKICKAYGVTVSQSIYIMYE